MDLGEFKQIGWYCALGFITVSLFSYSYYQVYVIMVFSSNMHLRNLFVQRALF
jgi:hypothetical protein